VIYVSQFLPQDKVSAFAQLNPAELLRETERAAGGNDLLNVHNELIDFRKKETAFLLDNESWNSKLLNLEDRNRAVEREVTRFLERDAILNKIKVLKLAIPWFKYDELATAYQECKEEKNTFKKDYDELYARVAPLEEKLQKEKNEQKKYDSSLKTSVKEVNDMMNVFFLIKYLDCKRKCR
jgi:chromosome segregation ATPase